MEALINTVLPGIDIDSPNFETVILPRLQASMAAGAHPLQQNRRPGPAPRSHSDEADSGALLESMVEATGRLDLDDNGNWDYHGHSSGMAFMKMMKDSIGNFMPSEIGKSTLLRVGKIPPMIEPSNPTVDSPRDGPNGDLLLPPKDVAHRLVGFALDDACALIGCLHRPTFDQGMNRIYEIPPAKYSEEDHRFLSLFYAVIAVGWLYSKDELKTCGLEQARTEGYV
jgi:hypothetical protein